MHGIAKAEAACMYPCMHVGCVGGGCMQGYEGMSHAGV